ncbi:MAG: pyrroline-5-carboxylate reductase [Oscillospiraceae bacterium]|nr:pyrroline-5-carboxylate reductase [Oscillospiraceae bacterium]
MAEHGGLRLGVIGTGNMACAILTGALASGVLEPEAVLASHPRQERRDEIRDSLGVAVTADNREVAERSDVILLAVKPQKVPQVLAEVGPLLAGKCLVSIAAGLSIDSLRRYVPEGAILRAMPNTPLMLGCGATVLTPRGEIPEAQYRLVFSLFEASGFAASAPEEYMNAVTAVSGSSPAYFFRMAQAMTEAAAAFGLAPDLALQLTAQTMEGAARMLKESGHTAAELTAQVCSPGGTTLAALTAFDDMGFDALIREALTRCVKRAEELDA